MRASMRLPLLPSYKRELLAERGLVEFFNPRGAETNMVSSLARAEEWLVDTCIVSYADIFYESSAVRLLMNFAGPLAVTYNSNWLVSFQAWSTVADREAILIGLQRAREIALADLNVAEPLMRNPEVTLPICVARIGLGEPIGDR